MGGYDLVTAGWVLIILYMAAILFFVVRGALKIDNISDYALGNIAFSPAAVGLSLAASITSAATFIINPGFVALYGLSGVLSFAIILPLGIFPSLIIFTKGFRKHGTVVKAATMAQWIGFRYKSPRFSLFFAFLSLLLLTFIVLICVGLTKVLSKTLNQPEFYVLLTIIAFIFGYMMFGGANSMVYTNTIQASIMLVVAFILLGSGYEHFSKGVDEFLLSLKKIDPNLVKLRNPESPLFRDFFEIIFCQLVVGVAIICQPHIITKSLLLKTDKDVNRYLLVGILAEAVFFLVVVAGLYARLSFPDLQIDGEKLQMDGILSAYVSHVIADDFHVYLALVVVIGLISAGISTLEALIQSLSTTITSDIIHPLFGQFFPKDEKKDSHVQVLLNRVVIILLAFLAAWFSYQQLISPNLSVAIFAQNGVYAYFAAAFVPVLFGTFLRQVPKEAPILGSLTAVITHFYIYYVGIFPGITQYMWQNGEPMAVRNPAIAATVAILLSFVVGVICLYVFRDKKEQKGIDNG